MNRKYIPVGMEIIEFETEDVIVTSPAGYGDTNDNPDDDDDGLEGD